MMLFALGVGLKALFNAYPTLREQSVDTATPVSGFVATLAAGRVVRVHMAPVFDSVHALNGFVLTLEDITRNIKADTRRDALLQTLTQDARATLANIRAALEHQARVPQNMIRNRFLGV